MTIIPFILHYTGEEVDTGMVILFLMCILILLGCGIPLLLYYKNHRVIFDQKNIISTNLYGKTTEVEWQYIEDIKFSALSGMITIKSYDKKAKLHQHLVGLITFIEEMEAQTKYTAQDLKIPIGS